MNNLAEEEARKKRVVDQLIGSSPADGLRDRLSWASNQIRRRASEDKSIWGFNLKFDGAGNPKVEEFGMRPKDKHIVHSGASEPLAEVFDQGDYVSVVLEVPGVELSEIDLIAAENQLKVDVASGSKTKSMKMDLPLPVIASSANAVLKNGVLEVKLLKK